MRLQIAVCLGYRSRPFWATDRGRRARQAKRVDLADSALHAPQVGFGDTDCYPNIIDKAAAVTCRIGLNHPLPDGNKRAAWACLVLFIDLTDGRWTPDHPGVDDALDAMLAVAARCTSNATASGFGNEWSSPSNMTRRIIRPDRSTAGDECDDDVATRRSVDASECGGRFSTATRQQDEWTPFKHPAVRASTSGPAPGLRARRRAPSRARQWHQHQPVCRARTAVLAGPCSCPGSAGSRAGGSGRRSARLQNRSN